MGRKKTKGKLSFELEDNYTEEADKFKFKPENIISLIAEEGIWGFSPYEAGYVPQLPKFIDDKEPEEGQFRDDGSRQWEVINDGDPDLTPIYFTMPSPPKNPKKIDGYGLDPDEQYFHRLEIPDNFKKIEKRALEILYEIEKRNRQDTIQGYKFYLKFWEIMEAEFDNLKDDIEWLKKIWWCRTYGYWFYNDGEPTFVPPDYFDFLNFYYISEAETYPEYRHDVRRKFCFAWYLESCTETFRDINSETGRAIKNAEGGYNMLDLGRRLFFGDTEPKTRRTGATHEALHKILKGSTTNYSFFSTIISFEGNNAEIHYKKKLLPAFDSMPMCLKPMWEGNRRPTILRLDTPPNVYIMGGLGSAITFSDSGGLFKNEGDRLNGLLNDEQGKCHGRDTEIIMSDGGIKKVQDITNGEYVMGADGTPRMVYGVTQGYGNLYEVLSKFGSFTCNEDHVLSLKTSMHTIKGGKYIGDIINFPIKEILKWHPQSIRNTKIYRGAIEYASQDVIIDPYFLGVWLGDGCDSTTMVTNIDKEIIDSIKIFAIKNGYGYSTWGINHNITNNQKQVGGLMRKFKKLNLYRNKHIPEEYLKNDREVRLQLLAGIIDTDGSRDTRERSMVYDIVQKRKLLAEQICQLANGLGFWSCIENKVATMKRKDGSIYRCDVYRVKIYGDLHKIPVKIKRKQYPEPTWWRNKNPNVSWYKITPIGEGTYYGFAVDGNHLFMLANQIVVHNSSSLNINIFERWNVNKFTMSTGMGINILKGAYVKNPSTVEEMESTAAPYYRLCMMSDFYRRIPVKGQTVSGFARIFLPAYLRMEGFIDRFGKSVISTPTERQIRLSPYAIFAIAKKGSRQMMQEERDTLLAENTPQSLETYRSIRRKSPFTWSECWLGSSGNVGFNLEIVDPRLGEINRLKSFGKTPYKVGYFYRENGNPDDKVLWKTDPSIPKFKMSMDLPPELTNQRQAIEVWDGLSAKVVPAWRPINGQRFTCGVDPFRSLKANEAKQASKSGFSLSNSRQSDGGIAILWEHDAEIDKSKNKKEWQSFRCVLSYSYRPATQDEYFQDVFMAAQYFGAMIYPENNVESFIVEMFKQGYGGYALYDIDILTGKQKPLPGKWTGEQTHQDMVRELKDYIENRGHMECHDDLLNEIKAFRGVETFTHHDLLVAFAYALLGSKSRYREFLSNNNNDSLDILDIFPVRSY